MNLRDLKYLVALADFGHFGKAAQYCCVSQPALSMQIMKLEDLLGIALLERNKNSILLTNIGKIIVEHARKIIAQIEEVKWLAQQAKDPFSGELTLGIIPTFGPYLLPHIIPELTKTFPKITFYLVEEQTAHLIEKLKQGKIEVALLALPISEPNLTTSPLFQEEFMLAVHHTHGLAKRKKIKSSDLKNQTLFLLEEGHCMRDQTLEFCHQARAVEENRFKATSMETLRHMVAANVGITLIPKLACNKNNEICYIPFNAPKPMRTAGMVWRSSSTKTQLLESIVCCIKETMKLFVTPLDS